MQLLVCINLLHNYAYLQRSSHTFHDITALYHTCTKAQNYIILVLHRAHYNSCRFIPLHVITLPTSTIFYVHCVAFSCALDLHDFTICLIYIGCTLHHTVHSTPPHPSGLRTPSLASRPHTRHLMMTREWKETLLPVMVMVQKGGPQTYRPTTKHQ